MLFELSVKERRLIIFSLAVASSAFDKAGGAGDNIDGAILKIIMELDPEGKIIGSLSDVVDKMTAHAKNEDKENGLRDAHRELNVEACEQLLDQLKEALK